MSPSDRIREAALAMAARERKHRQATAPRPHRAGGPIDLRRVPGPAWSSPKAAEAESIAALHAAGAACGRRHCPTCPQDQES